MLHLHQFLCMGYVVCVVSLALDAVSPLGSTMATVMPSVRSWEPQQRWGWQPGLCCKVELWAGFTGKQESLEQPPVWGHSGLQPWRCSPPQSTAAKSHLWGSLESLLLPTPLISGWSRSTDLPAWSDSSWTEAEPPAGHLVQGTTWPTRGAACLQPHPSPWALAPRPALPHLPMCAATNGHWNPHFPI